MSEHPRRKNPGQKFAHPEKNFFSRGDAEFERATPGVEDKTAGTDALPAKPRFRAENFHAPPTHTTLLFLWVLPTNRSDVCGCYPQTVLTRWLL